MFHKHPGGKGDKPILPKDQEQFDNNWDNIEDLLNQMGEEET